MTNKKHPCSNCGKKSYFLVGTKRDLCQECSKFKRGDKKWFVALIILNTFAILEIFYIFYIVKKNPKDIIKSLKSKI